jgi:hypothetical protein
VRKIVPAALLAATTSLAQAGEEMPTEVIGHWCAELIGTRTTVLTRCEPGPYSVEIDRRRVEWPGTACAVQEMGAHRRSDWLKLRCGEEERDYSVVLEGSQLYMTRRR